MAYYHKCTRCGANLDPGERCDCMGSRGRGAREGAPWVQEDAAGGQLRFTWEAMRAGQPMPREERLAENGFADAADYVLGAFAGR